MVNERVIRIFKEMGAEENVPLASVTTFRIGGPAALLFSAKTPEALLKSVKTCISERIPYAVIGNGSDILAPDCGFDGVIIRSVPGKMPFDIRNNRVKAFAGDSLTALARFTVNAGYSGLEKLCGIPASVGGACAMNAGAYGGEVKDCLASVRYFDGKAESTEKVDRSRLSYRLSPYAWPNALVLEAEFMLSDDPTGQSKLVMEECLRKRTEKQPLEYPSAGSVFKRPAGFFAGKLIEDSGLKGVSVGGAMVSEKHAGFIVNTGNATEHDVLALIELVQKRVFDLFGVELQREVKRLGEVVCIS